MTTTARKLTREVSPTTLQKGTLKSHISKGPPHCSRGQRYTGELGTWVGRTWNNSYNNFMSPTRVYKLPRNTSQNTEAWLMLLTHRPGIGGRQVMKKNSRRI